MNEKTSFFAELKRRNVYRVAIAYAVVAWQLMQVASQIFPFFEIANWAVRLVVLLVVIGFPVAMILAWAIELTPEGIKRADAPDATQRHSRTGNAELPAKSIAVLPFENLSDEKANAYFAEGIQNEIL